jgi:hypothetical protein
VKREREERLLKANDDLHQATAKCREAGSVLDRSM